MTKILKLLLAAYALFASHRGFAELIHWQLGESADGVKEYEYAQFVTVSSNGSTTPLHLVTVDENGEPVDSGSSFAVAGSEDFWAISKDSTFSSSDSFRIEVYDSHDQLVGWSWTVGYSAIEKFISNSFSLIESSEPWTPTIMPEPSSGLLMLVGGALLALRRRRKARGLRVA